jgi:predicted transcriptional regulator
MENSLSYYATIPSWLLGLDITNGEKIMCILLSSLSNKEGYCFATNQYLSEVLGMTENAVKISLGRLERGGIITIQNKKTKVSGNRRIYLSFVQKNPSNPEIISSFSTHRENKKIQTPKIPNVAVMEAFKKFYDRYPRKQKQQPAFDIFKRKQLINRVNDLINATDKYKNSVEGVDMKFIMLPTTFLNQGVWEEYLEEGEKKLNGAQTQLNPFDFFIEKIENISKGIFSGEIKKGEIDFSSFDDKERTVIKKVGFKNLLSNIVDGEFINDEIIPVWEKYHENN